MDQKALKQLEKDSDKEIAAISKHFDKSYDEALVGEAKRAIEQALLEMFGTRKKAEVAKAAIIESLQRVIKTFNDNLAKEIHSMIQDERTKLRTEVTEEFKKMRGEFMSELKNL